jgi:hypothetical protein
LFIFIPRILKAHLHATKHVSNEEIIYCATCDNSYKLLTSLYTHRQAHHKDKEVIPASSQAHHKDKEVIPASSQAHHKDKEVIPASSQE